jgi:hypothetical protein
MHMLFNNIINCVCVCMSVCLCLSVFLSFCLSLSLCCASVSKYQAHAARAASTHITDGYILCQIET